MTYSLRATTDDDYAFLYRLHVATMKDTVAHVWGWDDDFQADYFREHFDPSRLRIIVVDGTDVGVLAVEHREDALFFSNIEIAPSFQGRGLGTEIVRDLLAEASNRRLPVALQTNRSNPARRLYQRLGFVETGETETHYEMTAKPSAESSGTPQT
ncbi:MAG: GNAT family N-acetyltransferase [Thermomicrobiales bacterium]